MTIQSASRRVSSRSAVTSPMIRMASPGPGNGWRWETAHVVVGLDLLGGLGLGGGALDDVRVQRALGQEVDLAQLLGLLLEDPDELVADDPPLLLRIDDAGKPGDEPLARIDHHE